MGSKDNEHSMKELIREFINQHGRQQLYGEQLVMEKWPEYVGPIFAQQTHCVSIRNGVLHVHVPNAALRFEIIAHKSMIMERINADYPIPILKDILFF